MIPYFQWTQISLGPIPIQVWGLMVSLGMLAALSISLRVAKAYTVEKQHVLDMAFWIILGSIVGSRVAYVLSEWHEFAGHFIDVFKVWNGGMSISGGLVGAFLATMLYVRRYKLSFWEYADVYILGLPVGLWIGRLGCFFIFDHPGSPTTFFLGEQYIDGVVRHNHGLYLSLDGFILSCLFFLLWKKNPHRPNGWYFTVFLMWDGVVRFCLDFFRARDLPYADSRFFGLTMAQYLAMLMIVAGVSLWYTRGYAKHTKTAKSQ